ncbi:ribonuclease R [Falsiroseomonas sp. HW251]|uniref:ribonuclease R n=1 Tax=Falsiroseomonas sp. HW251 TaxID=3390998 RepID=UPI003D31F675
MPPPNPPPQPRGRAKASPAARSSPSPAGAGGRRAASAPERSASADNAQAGRGGGHPNLPTLADLRAFLRASPGRRVSKTDIARHFGLTTDQRPALRDLLRQLKDSGQAAPVGRRGLAAPDRLPEMTVVEIVGTDADGDAIARPVQWDKALGPPPAVFMAPERRGHPALAPGERVLARLRHIGGTKYEGRTFKRLASADRPARILGVFEEGRIIPTDRRSRAEWFVPPEHRGEAKPGDIVLAEPLPQHRPMGARPAAVVEVLGRMGEPRSVSLVCIHAHGIPDIFPAEAVQEAERARAVTKRGREDLTAVPLVTIDGEDARDFDDAVFAEPHEGGWRVLVAIADVAHYVKPGSALDREAWARGNSVYFPDRVVPMLPEALSNGWCSLRPNENRGCLFVEMLFDRSGTKTGHRFGRGLMRSWARLTYEKVQAAHDESRDLEDLPEGHLINLYGAFRALLAARERRGTLDLDVPERRVVLDPHGKVLEVVPRSRLDSHRLIEEFMVAANVAAAEELEKRRAPCMYRVHDRPSDEKLEGLRQFLQQFGIKLAPRDRIHPRDFSHVLEIVKDRPEARMVNEAVLRGQSQAAYSPDNIGHFGLALAKYAHFTSPIRRYADLLVHRALTNSLPDEEAARFPDTAEHITQTERRAAMAERDAVDRYLAAFMATREGELFEARISGVTRFGLFVTVESNGASGIVPLATLPDDRWQLDETGHGMTGRSTGLSFALGQPVEVQLVSATPRTGGMVFRLMQGDPRAGQRRPALRGGARPAGKPRGRPLSRRR